MCQSECPHKGEKMCSCEAIRSEDPIAQITHLFGSIREPKAELSYGTLTAPHPYRLCLSGFCGTCGGRLCISLEQPGDFSGDGFLAFVYRRLCQVFNGNFGMGAEDFRQMFTELFHEQDRPHIRHWLELPEQDGKTTVYTIVQTAADADRGLFPDPFARGSYLLADRARERLGELIVEEKKKLSKRMNAENLTADSWEAYERDYAAAHFVRIEILPSELSPESEGGPHNA